MVIKVGTKLLKKEAVNTKSHISIPSARNKLIQRETRSLRNSASAVKTRKGTKERKSSLSPFRDITEERQTNRKMTIDEVFGVIQRPITKKD